VRDVSGLEHAGQVAGNLARFTDAGLVYSNGARIRLIPFDQLPLR